MSRDAEVVYERYYGLVKQAMLDQVDNPVWKLINDRWIRRADHSEDIQHALAREYIAVVSCWRSASQVPPVPGTEREVGPYDIHCRSCWGDDYIYCPDCGDRWCPSCENPCDCCDREEE